MEEGYCNAMLMAAAGLQRLELDHYITEILDPNVLIPAVSQGVIAIESRENDTRIDKYLKEINHNKTWNAIEAERAFLHAIEGGCQVPVGCFTKFEGIKFTITGFVASVDGTQFLIDEEKGTVKTAHETGKKLAEKLRQKGAAEILANIRKQS
jgi:hydroxymethylbilane synthase